MRVMEILPGSRMGEESMRSVAERGQTLIEGAMIAGFTALLAMAILTALGTVTGDTFSGLSDILGAEGVAIPIE